MDPVIEHATTADGVSIAWASTGSGPALVVLPGVPFSNLEAEWRIPTLRRAYRTLAARLRVIQYDGRGTGRSQRDVDDVSLDAMLRDIDAVVAATTERRVVLLGFYNSCTHAIAWAARHPERVAGIVLFGGSVRGWLPMSGPATQALLSLIDQDWDTFVESATHAWLGWPDDADGRLAADWFRTATTPTVARATLRAASAVDVSDEAARVRCPTLVLHREGSPVVPRSATDELVAAVPDARLVVLPGVSPTLFFEEAPALVRLLVAFAEDPSASRPAMAPPAGRRTTVRGAVASSASRAAWPSPRELEVLRLVARGDSNAEIAAQLGLSVNTVERHLGNVYRKIDVRGRADATAWAIRNELA